MKKNFIVFLFIFLASIKIIDAQSIVNIYQTSNSNLVYDWINDICFDENNNLFIATEFGFSKLDQNDYWTNWNSPTDGLPENVIKTVYCETNIGVYLGGFLTGLSFYNNNQFENLLLPIEIDQFVRAITSNDAFLYVGTTNGIGIYNFANENWTYINGENTKIPSSNITSLALNEAGILYAGTINGGLLKIEENNLIYNYGETDGLPDNTILDIEIDNNGLIWMASPAAGLVNFDGTLFESINEINSNLPSNNLNTLAIASNNDLWIGTANNGLAKLNAEGFYTINMGNSTLPSNQINTILIEDSTTIWVGTNNGLIKISSDNSTSIEKDETIIKDIFYPNPSKGFLFFDVQNFCSEITVTNLSGKQIVIQKGEIEFLDLNNFANGSYVICCQSPKYYCQKIFLLK